MIKVKYKFWRVILVALVMASLGQAMASDDYSEEGERRAKLAGGDVLGTPARQMVIQTIDGKTIDLAQIYGKKPVYLKFWATWCVPCRQQMLGFEEIYQKYGDEIQVIAVNTGISDDLKSVDKFRKKNGLTMPITIDDGSLARAFHLRVTPQHVLINKSGVIRYVGHVDDAEFHQALEAVMAEEAPVAAVTPPALQEENKGYGVGEQIEAITLTSMDGKDYSLPSATTPGKPTTLVFFAPWCEWYLAETEPETSQSCALVREMLESQPADSDRLWLTVSTNLWTTASDLQDYQTTNKTIQPIIFDEDGTLFGKFTVNQVPTILVLNQKGEISEKFDVQAADFREKVNALFAK